MLSEEKPEEFASPEQNHEDGISVKKRRRGKKKKKKNNENPNPQVCSESLVESTTTLPDSNNIPKEKKNKNKSMMNGEEPKPALELGNKMEVESIEVSAQVAKTMTGTRKRKRVQKGVQSNDHNIEPSETAVQMSVDREVPPIDQTIAVNNQPANLAELKDKSFERPMTKKERLEIKARKLFEKQTMKEKMKEERKNNKMKGEIKSNGEGKPSTGTAVVMDTHPATPIVAEQNIAKKKHRRGKKKWEREKTNEHNGELHESETPVQISISPTTALSADPTVPIDQTIRIDAAVPTDPHPAIPIDPEQKKKKKGKGFKSTAVQSNKHNADSTAETSVQGTKGATVTNAPNDQHGKKKKVKGFKSTAVQSNRHNADSTAETSVQGTKGATVTNAPNDQHWKSSMVCSESLVESTTTLPDSNNIPKEKKNKNKSMMNGEEPKPALELGNKMEVESIEVSAQVAKTMTGTRKRKRVQKGVQSNDHNIEPSETAVQMSVDREVPPIDQTIAVNNQPANLAELKDKSFERPMTKKERLEIKARKFFEKQRMKEERKNNKMKGEIKSNGEGKPSTGTAVVMDTHPATPIVAEQKIAKKKHRRGKKKWEREKTNEHNGEPHESETPVQISISPTTALSADPTVPIDQTIQIDAAVPTDPHPAIPIDPEQKKKKKGKGFKSTAVQSNRHNADSTAETSVQGTKGATVTNAPNDQHGKKKKGKGFKSTAVQSNRHNADSTAETSVQGTKGATVTNAPNDQHWKSSMLCWACRETDHTIQQCRKLKSLSKDAEVCFFCGEIGHSLGRCSVYIAGGGRLARCLFCNAHGHFSYNCPGNGHEPKGWPVEAETKIQC